MHRTLLFAALLAAFAFSGAARASEFTYHGNLQDAGNPAEGSYDIELTLYSAVTGGSVIAGPLIMYAVPVHEGSFSTEADFGPLTKSFGQAFVGVKVRSAGKGEYAALDSRSSVTPDTNTSCPGSWSLDGNAGNPAGSYLGTADSQPLTIKVGNSQVAKALLSSGGTVASWIGGASLNSSTGSDGSFIGGGGSSTNSAQANSAASYSVVGGGTGNQAGSGAYGYATVAGGTGNVASGLLAAIGGGQANTASGIQATVAGGGGNLASSTDATVSGGTGNRASGGYSSVVGGEGNIASGSHATIGGGENNLAGGRQSFAAGYLARVRHPGADDITGSGTGTANGDDNTFVWSDSSSNQAFESSGINQFLVRASGGMAINGTPKNSETELSIYASAANSFNYSNIFMAANGQTGGILMSVGDATANNAGFYIDNYNGSVQARRMQLANDGSASIRSSTNGANTGVTLPPNGGAWSSLSDRNVKTAIAAIDPVAILQRLVRMPVSEWSYTAQGAGIRHMGPMAQDFAAAFSIGEDNTHISTIDADGVAFAAIKGLNQKLESENAALQKKLDDVLARLGKLENEKGE